MSKQSPTCKIDLHDRVYDHSRILTSNPPKKAWVCRECGQEGVETVGVLWENESEYDRVIKRFVLQED
jgi:hypothetical protein